MKNNIITLFILTILLSLSFGNEPIGPPYYSYSISGSVECDTLEDKSQLIISLFSRQKDQTIFTYLVGSPELNNTASADITDKDGAFSIIINSYEFYDSLKISYNYLHQPKSYGESFSLNKDALEEVYINYSQMNNGGCSSCTTENVDAILSHYLYVKSDIKINMCN